MKINRKKIFNAAVSEVGEHPVILTVCDDNYFNFAKALVLSAEKFSAGMDIILHIINPTSNSIQQIEKLKSVLKFTKLHISIEKTVLSEADDSDLITYYASARFLLIPELLKEFSRDIFCLDADSLIVNVFDNNFTDKIDADICLIRRDILGETRENLKVATGSIYIRNNSASKKFFAQLRQNLLERIDSGNLPWFTDQIIFSELIDDFPGTAVRNLKGKYADWNFSLNSMVWAGKGESKATNLNFLLLQSLLLSSEGDNTSINSAVKLIGNKALHGIAVYEKFTASFKTKTNSVSILIPRLDLPWKQPNNLQKIPSVSESTLNLRSQWKTFSIMLANAFQSLGINTDIEELPGWEINNSIFDKIHADIIFIPHKCRHEFSGKLIDRPVYFYMQEFFSWLFTVDAKGWSAASSVYPVNYNNIVVNEGDKYSQYQQLLLTNRLASKFSQPDNRSICDLVQSGEIPSHSDPRIAYKKFIFFPLQIPNDQSILYFSDYSEELVIEKLLEWSAANDVPVVFKPHPANPKSMVPLIDRITAAGGYIANANIHELIGLSSAVYTINSGVGFEALFHNKPIVTFGKVEYDCCTFKATPDSLEMAWIYCLLSSKNNLLKGYSKFVNWFISDYAYDISDYEQATTRLRMLAKRIKKKHFADLEKIV
jgi:Capsule polysaccharide biosynthesis protein